MSSVFVFAYGTLEVPAVMEAVTGWVFDSAEAIAEDYARFLLKGRIYPGMTPVSGETTGGRVYFEVTQQALMLLDKFEDEIYVRQSIAVRTDEGHWYHAYAYIIEPKDREVLSVHPWIREKFVEDHLTAYLAGCRKFHLGATRSFSTQSPKG
ncbi:MAG: gamma-glutamylcyclotransferase [Nitrospirota bacterium]|nr:MAG: gamma-glutamylcyclotransferase [Nitrospirota bacterium]